MNRRTLKKKCKRAVRVLIEHYGYAESDFQPSDGSETLDAPPRMESQYLTSLRFFYALKGTPLYWKRSSYEYDEWDCELPTEFLATIRFWENFRPAEEDLAA